MEDDHGNRGKCAQTCRLPFSLLEENNENFNFNKTIIDSKQLDKGYLLSTRDLCSLELIPYLIKSGVTSFKIEGRMKTPEYVATVTRIYRKYIDLALSGETFTISNEDKHNLMQVFNRGGFSKGHLDTSPNKNLIFKEKQNNMGIYLGTISKYNSNKGLVTVNLKDSLKIGDTVSFERENSKYNVSELLNKDKNIPIGKINENVTLGRMKGNIKIGDKVYKISSKELSTFALSTFSKEYKKNKLELSLYIQKNKNIIIKVYCPQFNKHIDFEYDYISLPAENKPIDKEKIINQFSKTTDTCFEFSKFDIILDDKLFIPVSVLNDIRRTTIINIQNAIISDFKRNSNSILDNNHVISNSKKHETKISLLLNILNTKFNYSKLENIEHIYIPLKYFSDNTYLPIIDILSKKSKIYIYMPTILRKNYYAVANQIIETAFNKYDIYGIVISNLSQLKLNLPTSNLVSNYTLNTYNSYTAQTLSSLGINTVTISPEADKESIINLCNNSNIQKELLVYGRTAVMTMNYCPLGKSNKCYSDCDKKCLNNNTYYLKDRMGFKFRVIPDNTQTITTIYNSKITSIDTLNFNIDYTRIDILDEDINEINNIILAIKNKQRLEGKDFTNGNLNREI